MTVDVELDGRRRAVTVRRETGGWVVSLDGRPFVASLVEVGGRWSLLVSPGEDVGRVWRSYEVSFDARGRGEHVVNVNGEPVPLAIVDSRAARGRRAREGVPGHASPDAIVAPMPGRVVKVLVVPGDAVAARQGVVVVEAMKMENELRARRAGTVREVRVSEGMAVDANMVLVVLE